MGRTHRKRKRKPQSLVLAPQIDNLYAFIQRLGFQPKCPLRLARTPGSGRGLICLRNINKGDVIIDLPQSLLITPELVRAMYGLEGGILSREEVLTVFVISEKLLLKSSRWKPYIDSIPDRFDSLHSNRVVEGLPERLRLAVGRCNDDARNSFSRLKKHFMGKGLRLTFEVFNWAWCAVYSRCIYVEGRGSTLAPFLDLLNHHWKASTETSFIDNHFIIQSNDRYRAGEEVFISYGSHDNRTLFLNYGFVLDGNPNDCVTVEMSHLEKLRHSERISRFDEKIAFLHRHNKLTGQTGFTHEGATWNLDIILQVLQDATDENWKRILSDEPTADVSRLQKVLATQMLGDYDETTSSDFMRRKLLEIERKILLSVINEDHTGGIS